MKSKIIILVLVLSLGGMTRAQRTYIVFMEDFEGLTLGPNVEEATAGDEVWTDTPPAGWTIDESGVPGVGNPATDGMTEWAGWAFTNKEWWIQIAGDQRRSEFVLGQGTIAVADPDEWDDAGHPGPISSDPYDTWLSTPAIDISTSVGGSVQLKFDSSWRPEYDSNYHQTANLTVSFDGAEPIELFRWESDSTSPNFKPDDSTNETITVNVDNPSEAMSMVFTFGLFDAGNDWWWAIDNIVVTAERNLKLAYDPDPQNRASDVPWRTVLSWMPGEYVKGLSPKHKVILSDNFDDVRNGTAVVAIQDSNSYDPAGLLNFDTTYYWRIDEANSTTGWDEGKVWQFTTEPVALAIDANNITATASSQFSENTRPENTIDGSGLDENDLHSTDETGIWVSSMTGPQPTWIQYEFDRVYKLHQMWVWNHNTTIEPVVGFGIKDATIEYSIDGANWTTLGTAEFVRAPGLPGYAANTTVDFSGVPAKYVKITANSNWGGILPQYGLSEVRFFYIPVVAREPNPASGTAGVDVEAVLSWRTGREAASHHLYLSSDEQAVIDETVGAVTIPADRSYANYATGPLDLGQSYYWKVNEVNEAETPATWQGDVWDFSTQEYLVVDDFEDYNDFEPDRIFDTWVDGWGDPTNGSQVGSDVPPFAEQTIVHGGKQSMPLNYDNSTASYSEATANVANLPVGQDWTKYVITTLSLWFYGDPGNAVEQLYVKLNGSKVAYDGNAANLALMSWQLWNIDLTLLGVNLNNVTQLSIGLERSGVVGGKGVVYIDDIRLYRSAPAPVNEWRITDDADDVEEAVATGSINMTSSDLELPYENTGQGNPQTIGVRFTGIPIPKGATITDAWVRFQVDETKGGTEPVNLIIEGELSPNAAGFTSDAFNVSSRPRTTAQVQWSVPNWTTVGEQGPDQTTPSIASIIQEIVNQDGWLGNALVLMFRDNPANPSLGIRCAEAGPGSDAALLHIDYQ